MSDLFQVILKAVIWEMIYLKMKESRFNVITIIFFSFVRTMKCFLNMEKKAKEPVNYTEPQSLFYPLVHGSMLNMVKSW